MRKIFSVFLFLYSCIWVGQTLSAQSLPTTTGSESQTSQPSSSPQEIEDGDTVRVETALVAIPVSVTDRKGRFIPDLTRADFQVFENGVEQQLAYFAPVEKPFTVALLLDTSGSTASYINEIKDAANVFINQLRPNDRVLIVSFAGTIFSMSGATSDRQRLRNAVASVTNVKNVGGTSLYDAVHWVINTGLRGVDGRIAIVLFTDGVDTTSQGATAKSNFRDAEELGALIYSVNYDTYAAMNNGQRRMTPLDDATDYLKGVISGGARNSGSSRVYTGRGSGRVNAGTGGTVGPGIPGTGIRTGSDSTTWLLGPPPGASRKDYETADLYLKELAARSGGEVYRTDKDQNLDQAFALVAEQLRRQYSIGYYPESVLETGKRIKLKVRVTRPKVIVRARKSYVVSSRSDVGTEQPAQR
jgi:VWFA-related protein